MGREENKIIFKDTENMCRTNAKLVKAIQYSDTHQKLILEDSSLEEDENHRFIERADIIVSKKRTFAAAKAYARRATAVLNFASATNPGGGVVGGSSAQEECLCRCSTLYFNLNTKEMWDGFYGPHRESGDQLHNDDCIYTPRVMVFKSDTEAPALLPEEEWYSVNVITCAAPNLRKKPGNRMNPAERKTEKKLTEKELFELHKKRTERVLEIAKQDQNDAVILGAFGCGAFANPPHIVAKAMKDAVSEYLYDFATIEFAVYCTPRDDSNYRVFERTLSSI